MSPALTNAALTGRDPSRAASDGPLLRPRRDHRLAAALARSAAATAEGHQLRTAEVSDWLARRSAAHRFRVDPVPLSRLDGWTLDPTTGDLAHRSGRFFTVEGLDVRVTDPAAGTGTAWQQPIINQPETGILGILAAEFDGVLHLLMQAKMEPGNRNLLQLSPTVQATRSNYTGAHRGGRVRYLEHFTADHTTADHTTADRTTADHSAADPDGGSRSGDPVDEVLVDVLQSEHGSWFHRKLNRNAVVLTHRPPPAADDFCWLTLGQLGELLRRDNVVNMDARTVLSCLPAPDHRPDPDGPARALCTDAELRSWFTVERSRHDVSARRVPLGQLRGWEFDGERIRRPDDRYFHVMGVAVQAGSREVAGWSQPLLEPRGTGVTAFLVRRFDGVPHLLVQAKVEAGTRDTAELAPTVQATPGNWEHLPAERRPPFLDAVLAARPDRIRYRALHSEEGGRFRHAESDYLFVDADPDTGPVAGLDADADGGAPLVPPAGFRWATPDQLRTAVRAGQQVNVQARSLLALLTTGAVRLDDGV